MKNKLLFLILSLLTFSASAQDMATEFRKDGKIYVVIAVASIVLTGIFVYLILMDVRLRKLEQEQKEFKKH
jgi:CcmD family protein